MLVLDSIFDGIVSQILNSAVILIAAGIAWSYHTRISSRRATLDLVMRAEITNPESYRQRRVFLDVSQSSGLSGLLKPEDASDYENARSITSLLNHYEFISTCIKNHTINEKVYKEWNRTVFVKTWMRAETYIQARRDLRRNHAMYREFQNLAQKWQLPTDQTSNNVEASID